MKLTDYFNVLLKDTVNLGEVKLDLLDSRVESVYKALKADEQMGSLILGKTPQGSHPTADRTHRDARSRQPHGLRLLVDSQPRSAAWDVATAKVGEHCGAVDAVPLSESLHTHPGQVIADERVHLGGGEKSLSRLDSPHHRAAIVPRSGVLGPSGDRVDPTVQAVDQGFRLGVELPNVLLRHPTHRPRPLRRGRFVSVGPPVPPARMCAKMDDMTRARRA